MKLIKKIIYWILGLQFHLITFLRNKFYDFGILKSFSFEIPVISVGNLAVGGTGKTPMVEFLIKKFSDKYNIAVLSRGYKRKTKGFIIASEKDDVLTIGDESFQYYSKFKNIKVAVDEKRRRGISKLIKAGVNMIILDDAFQHRKVIPTYSILLSDYSNLYFNDYLLPRGNLRESRSGCKRADSIIITKCPENFSENNKRYIIESINLKSNQHIFFSKIKYSDELFSANSSINISKLSNKKVDVITGIVKPENMIKHLEKKGLLINHFKYPDHYNYKQKDILKLNDNVIITTEKDYTKLRKFNIENLYYLPMFTDVSAEKTLMEKIEEKIEEKIG